jgi:thiaminase
MIVPRLYIWNSMNDINEFIDSIEEKSKSLINRILNHQYISSIENGKIPKEKIRLFAIEQYYIISNDRRSFAIMASRASDNTSAGLFKEYVKVEDKALANLDLIINELNISKNELEFYEPIAGCQAYTNYLSKLALQGLESSIVVAMLVDLPIWGKNCGRIGESLKKNYKFTEESCIFFHNFATPFSQDYITNSNKIIRSNLQQNYQELRIAARLILDYELLFWDTIYQHSI